MDRQQFYNQAVADIGQAQSLDHVARQMSTLLSTNAANGAPLDALSALSALMQKISISNCKYLIYPFSISVETYVQILTDNPNRKALLLAINLDDAILQSNGLYIIQYGVSFEAGPTTAQILDIATRSRMMLYSNIVIDPYSTDEAGSSTLPKPTSLSFGGPCHTGPVTIGFSASVTSISPTPQLTGVLIEGV